MIISAWADTHGWSDAEAQKAEHHNCVQLQAAVVVCKTPLTSFDQWSHLTWGDVAVAEMNPPLSMGVHFKGCGCRHLHWEDRDHHMPSGANNVLHGCGRTIARSILQTAGWFTAD